MNGKFLNLTIVLVALLLAIGLGLKLRGGSANPAAPQAAPEGAAPPPGVAAGAAPSARQANEAAQKTTVTESGATVVLEGSLAATEDAAKTGGAALSAPLNTLPPSELMLTDVKNYTSENGLTVLVLRDGSRLLVNDFVYEQLPESIRFRLDYERGGEQ